MRINKYLAGCGIASRRKSEALITDGKVRINGRKAELTSEVEKHDVVTVDGQKVSIEQQHIYLMLHKPKGIICSTSDEHGRKTVLDLVPAFKEKRLFPVGRLDYDTEGLLILTTDGELAQRLTHPKNEVEKTYVVKLEGEVSAAELDRIRGGILLDGQKTKHCKAVLLGVEDGFSRVEVKISEGRNRQVRRMFEAVGREVAFLKRTAVGGLKLGGLSRGEYRELKEKEINILKTC